MSENDHLKAKLDITKWEPTPANEGCNQALKKLKKLITENEIGFIDSDARQELLSKISEYEPKGEEDENDRKLL